MRKTLTIALLLTIALIGVASPTSSLPRARNLTILYFNDIHGHLEPWKPDAKSDATIGGIARIATVVERIRRENRALRRSTVLLQAGDILQGTPLSAVYQGEPDIECFNIMGVDAMTLGNHEFDFGKSNVAKLVERADFPILSANVFWTDGRPFARASTVVESNGLRVGVLGLTTAETPSTTFPTNVADLTFDDPIRAARYAVPVLEPHCDIVVALTHLGVPEDRRLAAAVPAIDVIVGGHTHAKLITPERVGNTVIVQAQDYGRFLGRLDLRIEPDGRVLTERAELIPIDASIPDSKAVAEAVDRYSGKLKDRLSMFVGTTNVLLDGDRPTVRSKETTLGNLMADLSRNAAHTDMAFINSGSLRASILPGKVTFGDILTTLPFNTVILSVKLPGRTVREILGFSASLNPEEQIGGFLQVSGVRFVIENGQAREIFVGDAPLDDDRVYTVAVPDFLLAGGDGYTMIAPATLERIDTGIVLTGLLVDHLRSRGVIDAKIEGRIVRR